MSCYDPEGTRESTVALEAANLTIFNFKDKFLVHGSYPESLWIIEPALDGLIEKKIALPEGLDTCCSTSVGDDLMISGFLNQQYDQPKSHFLIGNVSSDQPTMMPLVFLPEGYDAIGVYLKNNYVFSIGNEMGNFEDNKTHEKSGVFVIYDFINQQKCVQKFMPYILAYAKFAGTTLFFEAADQMDIIISEGGFCPPTYGNKRLMGID